MVKLVDLLFLLPSKQARGYPQEHSCIDIQQPSRHDEHVCISYIRSGVLSIYAIGCSTYQELSDLYHQDTNSPKGFEEEQVIKYVVDNERDDTNGITNALTDFPNDYSENSSYKSAK